MQTRRDFVRTATLLAGAVANGATSRAEPAGIAQPTATGVTQARMLVLGGTGFIGPHLVRHAVSRGHKVTIFTRGRRQADLPESVMRLVGDRNGQLDALKGRTWDIVIDDSATNPDWVRQSTELLRDAVGRYLFTSSTGVYYPYLKRGCDENDLPPTELADPKDGSETFGVNKALCERLNQKVGAAGLGFRPVEQTLTDTLAWWPSVPEERRAKPRFAIGEDAEAKALAAWRARK